MVNWSRCRLVWSLKFRELNMLKHVCCELLFCQCRAQTSAAVPALTHWRSEQKMVDWHARHMQNICVQGGWHDWLLEWSIYCCDASACNLWRCYRHVCCKWLKRLENKVVYRHEIWKFFCVILLIFQWDILCDISKNNNWEYSYTCIEQHYVWLLQYYRNSQICII